MMSIRGTKTVETVLNMLQGRFSILCKNKQIGILLNGLAVALQDLKYPLKRKYGKKAGIDWLNGVIKGYHTLSFIKP